jgi:hypothetical protein
MQAAKSVKPKDVTAALRRINGYAPVTGTMKWDEKESSATPLWACTSCGAAAGSCACVRPLVSGTRLSRSSGRWGH